LGFFVIADARTYLAFALAGLPGGAAQTPAETRQLMVRGRGEPGVGLILITQRLAQEIQGEVDAARREGTLPLILEIPDLAGPVPGAPPLLARLRALMGFSA
jgi:V/A-type H+-transporting ATPase subunit F